MSDATPLHLLFVCVGNSCRSQMAEGLARTLGGDRVRASSAGAVPAEMVAPKAVRVLEELGIDISGHQPKPISRELVDAADAVFIMGCDVRSVCPAAFLEQAIDWELEDPMGQGVERYREVRDLIRQHIEALLRDEGIEPAALG